MTFTLSGERNPIPCEPYGLTRYQICLIRSKNNYKKKKSEEEIEKEIEKEEENRNKYVKYYLYLEECVEYYNNFQLKSKQSEISRLIKLLEESNKDNKEIKKELEEIKEQNNKLQEQNDKLQETLDENLKETKEVKKVL